MRVQGLGSVLTLSVIGIALDAIRSVNAVAISPPVRRQNSSVDTIAWRSCGPSVSLRLQCAYFRVPLDWADESKGTIRLAVIRLPHDPSQPYDGYMFYNPGGPGVSGVEMIAGGGEFLQSQIGASFDVIGWDPRGVGLSDPNIALFDTDLSRAEFWSPTQGLGHMDAHGNLTTQPDIDFYLSQAPAVDTLFKSYDDRCVAKLGDSLKYVGTAATVRDLVAITEAIYGPGADINFYGYSYGTVIGTYLTQMFPDRVGKVIIDGVVDAPSWANVAPMAGIPIELESSEKALEGWASYCVAAYNDCAMAQAPTILGNHTGSVTTSDVLALVDQIFDTAYRTYDGSLWLTDEDPATITGFNYGDFGHLVIANLYAPDYWRDLDAGLVSILAAQLNIPVPANLASKKRAKWFPNMRKPKSPIGFWPSFALLSENTFAIACGDGIDSSGSTNTTTEDLFNTHVNTAKTITRHFASSFVPQTVCHRWTSRAVERFTGPFTTKPKNVVLVIGNTADPITPYSNAQKIASGQHLGNMARLVKLNAIGHTSGSNNSTCISNVVRSFLRGTIPADAGNDEPDVECDINSGNPFNNP